MKKGIIILVAILAVVVGFRYGFNAFGQHMQAVMMANRPAPSVTLGEVGEAEIIQNIEAPGRVNSEFRIDVLARISGYLTKSYFKEGDMVRKGQVLFEIEPAQYAIEVQKAQANVNNTRAQLIYAEKQVIRSAELVKKDYISKSSYDQVISQRDALRAQLSMYQAALADANRNYGYTRVKAPTDGQVSLINVPVGNFVTPTTGALTTINSVNPIYVLFPIDSKAYQLLTKYDGVETKRTVDLEFANGEKYELQGIQNFHDNKVDAATGTVNMRATFANPSLKLLHGDYVKINLYSNTPVTVPVVSQAAVLENPQGKYVYKIDKDGNAQINQIFTAGQDGDNWIVVNGLEKGDKVITDGLQKVIPGRPVKAVSKEEMETVKAGQKVEEAKEKEKDEAGK